MKKIESLFVGAGLLAAVAVTGGLWWHNWGRVASRDAAAQYPVTKYGAFLAAQHAIYVNDFDAAAQFVRHVPDEDYAVVQNTRMLAEFLSGKMPNAAKLLGNEKATPARLIYDAQLVQNDDWDAVYKRHKKDESALAAPLRIWSSVATKRSKDALKFIEKLPVNDSWQEFVRGQIYVETGDVKRAADAFARVRTDFMNINDYQYLMSFYRAHDMNDAADKLRNDFAQRPGSMFMLTYDDVPAWETFAGTRNQLAFSLVQNVSHTQVMMYSDLALLLLRFAQMTHTGAGDNADTIHYYLGQYFYNNNGDYAAHFSAISPSSPFYIFGQLRRADKTGDMALLQQAVAANPLFVPGINKLVAHYVQHGDKKNALRVLNRALGADDLTGIGRAFFLKGRAQVHLLFNELDNAQRDIHDAAAILPMDGDILALQAKIWAAQNRELDNAYDYAMALVRQNPTDIAAWDTLGCVVAVREGVDAALDVLARVGEVAGSCSSLFEHLGDLYSASGNKTLARDAYMRAIDLSADGLTVVPVLEKKLRKLK
ncbi:MAG: hypothetical protein K2L95_00050 [Alphaproteobacteria bacterium]|nr:hypothetical protein [Alphaproteobacteria bacterium]